ncbi:hypothetical protein PGT21_006096 [Puccinia graminis f. sp. tritici]|uniref:Uncharacterized protein n=1 Tax=Puccinia graminis f. sp. tritici TaxID=56615 RepID=A0A5B0LNL0_PUCGR|nr:hypothetical protein PGT21_006096 [Puccinia graminis f. sp. tritici]
MADEAAQEPLKKKRGRPPPPGTFKRGGDSTASPRFRFNHKFKSLWIELSAISSS